MENKWDLDKKLSAIRMMARPRFNYHDILRTVINADIRESDTGPHICLDECANNHIVKATIQDLLNRGMTSGSSELWNQVRIGADGSLVCVMDGLPSGFSFPGLSVGKPLTHATSDDQLVVYLLLAHFATIHHACSAHGEHRNRSVRASPFTEELREALLVDESSEPVFSDGSVQEVEYELP